MLKFTHIVCYLMLSAFYGAAGIGFDKTAVSFATALIYLVLALDEFHKAGRH